MVGNVAQNHSSAIMTPMKRRTTMNVSVPPVLRRWIEKRTKSGSFETASEYIRYLVRRDRSLATLREEVEHELLQAFDEPAEPWTKTDIEAIRSEGRRRLSRTTRRKSA